MSSEGKIPSLICLPFKIRNHPLQTTGGLGGALCLQESMTQELSHSGSDGESPGSWNFGLHPTGQASSPSLGSDGRRFGQTEVFSLREPSSACIAGSTEVKGGSFSGAAESEHTDGRLSTPSPQPRLPGTFIPLPLLLPRRDTAQPRPLPAILDLSLGSAVQNRLRHGYLQAFPRSRALPKQSG